MTRQFDFKVILTAAPKYQLNSQSEPRVVDSALSEDSQPQRKIAGKHVLQDGSISFRLGLELSFSDTIEVSADVILDHVSFDDLQSFEHAQFEAELAQKEKEEREYELAKGSKKCRGRPRKIRVNALSSTNDERQGLQGDVSDSDENSSESDSEEISGKNESNFQFQQDR